MDGIGEGVIEEELRREVPVILADLEVDVGRAAGIPAGVGSCERPLRISSESISVPPAFAMASPAIPRYASKVQDVGREVSSGAPAPRMC